MLAVERLRELLYQRGGLIDTRQRAEAIRLIDLIYTYIRPVRPRITYIDLAGGGCVAVQHDAFEIAINGERVPLTPVEFSLVEYVVVAAWKGSYARIELLGDILTIGNMRFADNASPDAHLLKTHLSHIRGKLGLGRPGLIDNVWGRGWRLNPALVAGLRTNGGGQRASLPAGLDPRPSALPGESARTVSDQAD